MAIGFIAIGTKHIPCQFGKTPGNAGARAIFDTFTVYGYAFLAPNWCIHGWMPWGKCAEAALGAVLQGVRFRCELRGGCATMLEASGDGLRLPCGVYNARRLTTIPPAFVRK